ncbi:hypothetical protein EIN_084620 [Entamoeba invadens IP1]|uniref:hypothetical protein n=1 Tax=Entamoeba invadens IP1 TaxID=370355 RepID=UPI0002C3D858|nr:hypothetical protein EIN_084620 [Entamoeba invadens IP1]ELP85270.1 hypothetical protein EIN_084620 [Entamoeba invadens IP1]|eukprot:XP_004184616.1 hypothetical protein EIN_084620 [Entamoeba invadens IP1]
MQYHIDVQKVQRISDTSVEILLLVSSQYSHRTQLHMFLSPNSSLLSFFDVLQSQLIKNNLIATNNVIQYKQFGPPLQTPLFTLLEQFTSIDIMSEDKYLLSEKKEVKHQEKETLQKDYNVSCHRCKTRRSECYKCTKNSRHKFCENCILKYMSLETFAQDGCPVCRNQCQCASCKRRELKKLGIEAATPKR